MKIMVKISMVMAKKMMMMMMMMMTTTMKMMMVMLMIVMMMMMMKKKKMTRTLEIRMQSRASSELRRRHGILKPKLVLEQQRS